MDVLIPSYSDPNLCAGARGPSAEAQKTIQRGREEGAFGVGEK